MKKDEFYAFATKFGRVSSSLYDNKKKLKRLRATLIGSGYKMVKVKVTILEVLE